MINQALRQDVSRTAVREQGGWKGRAEDGMPDNYAREMMSKALEIQERLLRHLRAGGDTVTSVLTGNMSEEPPKGGELRTDGEHVSAIGAKGTKVCSPPESSSSFSDSKPIPAGSGGSRPQTEGTAL